MNNRTYQRFVPQEDNTNDVIQAEDINELQRSIEKLQEDSFVQGDASFLNRCLFALEHHPDANSMIVDLLEDNAKLDESRMTLTYYDETAKSLALDESFLTGTAVTRVIVNKTGRPFRKLVLLADEYKPEGTSVTYEISYNNQTYYPITANQAIPIQPPEELAQFYLRITFQKNNEETSSPRVDAWALLYLDTTYAFRFLDDGLNIDTESDWDGTIIG